MTAVPIAVGVAAWCMLLRRAYRHGRRRATRRLSPALADELRRHKVDCLHESPERVRLELLLLVGVGEQAPCPSRARLSALGHRLAAVRALLG